MERRRGEGDLLENKCKEGLGDVSDEALGCGAAGREQRAQETKRLQTHLRAAVARRKARKGGGKIKSSDMRTRSQEENRHRRTTHTQHRQGIGR